MINQPQKSSPWKLAGLALAMLLVAWFFLVWTYFLRGNAQLWQVFAGLFGSYSFSLEHTPPIQFLQSIIALGITVGFGLLIQSSLHIRLTLLPRLCLALTLGFGISGIAFELLTMARLLYTIPVWIVWTLLFAGVYACRLFAVFRDAPLLDGQAPSGGHINFARKPPRAIPMRVFWVLCIVVTALITLATFWNALFFPETYWDSLILYLGYGRMTFLEHGFPFKAEAQVGIGLGANYPHIFSNYGAVSSMMFGGWTDLHQRLISPVAGLACCIFVYATALEIWRRPVVAAAAMLLFRAVPYGIAYATYASDYAFAILFAAAFIYAATLFAKRFSRSTLIMLTLIPAISMHLNYLMGILWVPYAFVVLLTITFHKGFAFPHIAFARAARSGTIWAIFLAGLALASPWYIRNTVLTGNPVYAFFPELFPASIRINEDVLKSAKMEWFRHGDGIGKMAELYRDLRTGESRNESDPKYRRESHLPDRLTASYAFWMGYDVIRVHEDEPPDTGLYGQRLLHLLKITRLEPNGVEAISEDLRILRWPHYWKMTPLFPGLFFPCFLLVVCAAGYRYQQRRSVCTRPERVVGPATALLLSFLLLLYKYVLADFYLYQIIPILIPAAIIAAWGVNFVCTRRFAGGVLGYILLALVCFQGLVPGLTFGLMNFKVFNARVIDGQFFNPIKLDVFRNPGMPESIYFRLAYGPDYDMWTYVNENLKDERLLTHENRHYLYDPSITLVHLDDWDIQQGYGIKDPAELYEFLKDQGINYYLRIPKEQNHPINRRLRMDLLEESGYLELAYQAGEDGGAVKLFKLVTP